MKAIKLLIVFFLTATFSLHALAHSQLASSIPEGGTTVVNAPTEVVMTFKKGIRLTKVTVTRAGTKSIKLKLDKKVTFQTDYTLVLEDMSIGDYLIEWRGLSEDGHVLKGEIAYSVK